MRRARTSFRVFERRYQFLNSTRSSHVYDQLREITTRLEKHYKDMQDFEFTIQDGKLYMLQTRNGKRTGWLRCVWRSRWWKKA